MIVTKSDLSMSSVNEATFLTEQEATFKPNMAPIIESEEGYRVEQSYIDRVSESQDCAYLEALNLIEQANGIENVGVVIDEARSILDPRLVSLYENFYIKPISENNYIYMLCESIFGQAFEEEDCLDLLDEAYDDLYDESMADSKQNQPTRLKTRRVPGIITRRVPGLLSTPGGVRPVTRKVPGLLSTPGGVRPVTRKVPGILNNGSGEQNAPAPTPANKEEENVATSVADAQKQGESVEAQAKKVENSKDPNIIAKAIASFRKLYHNFMVRVQSSERRYAKMSPSEQNKFKGRKNIFKHIAAKILSIIDRLTSKLQYLVDRRKDSEMSDSDKRKRAAVGTMYNRKYGK